jgi:hypothetical protein
VTPLELSLQFATQPPAAPLPLPLVASAALPPRLGNATRHVATYGAGAALSYVGTTAPALSAFPAGALTAVVSLPNVPAFGGAALTLALAACSGTASLQQGVNCSADSPPAPAPSAATELLTFERRRQRRRALLQTDAVADEQPLSGFFGGGGGDGTPRPPAVTTCHGYYRTVTLLTAATLEAVPPAPPDTASGAPGSPNWTLALAPCGSVRTVLSAPVTEAQWRADSRQSPPAWCADWASAVAAAGGAQQAALTLMLRSTGDPVLAAGTLTHCRMALGVPPKDYARRGMLCIALGLTLSVGGLAGLAHAAAQEGHALGVAAPIASLRAAYEGYGATDASSAAMGTPAAFTAVVGVPTRRRAPGVPAPPQHAAPFDGVTDAE